MLQGVLTSDYVVSAGEVSADGQQLMVDRDPMETLRQIITRVGQHQNDGYVIYDIEAFFAIIKSSSVTAFFREKLSLMTFILLDVFSLMRT